MWGFSHLYCIQLFHWFIHWWSAASCLQWQIITIIILSALLSPKCLTWTPPPPHPHYILLISPSGACRLDWISYNILSTASSIIGADRSSDVKWEKHFYRQVGGAQSEWFTAGAGGGGGVYSGGSSVDRDSILIAQQPKAVEGVERNGWKLWEWERSSGRYCVFFAVKKGVL